MPAAVLPLALCSLFAALHALGERRATRLLRRPRSSRDHWRAASYYAGLIVIAIALVGPIDTLALKLFWVHMVQHVLLLGVAAPLIVLGAPWMSVWRPLPLGLRRATAGTIARSPGWAPLRALGRLLSRPIPVWIAFTVNLVAWHIPVVYDFALSHQGIHDLEHLLFLLFAVLLWTQVIDSPPLHVRLSQINRVYYVATVAVPGWIISLVLVFSSSPLYPFYAHLNHRPGGISALADQQLAGGMMLLPGSLAFTIYVFFQIYVWLGSDQQARPPRGGGPGALPPPSPPTQSGPPADVDDTSPRHDRELVGAGARGVEARAAARASTERQD